MGMDAGRSGEGRDHVRRHATVSTERNVPSGPIRVRCPVLDARGPGRFSRRVGLAGAIVLFLAAPIAAFPGVTDSANMAGQPAASEPIAAANGPRVFPPPAPLDGRRFPVPAIPYAPRTYACARTVVPLTIDGMLDEPDWQAAPWTEEFGDIEGPSRPAPRYHTRVRMLHDDGYFYVAAQLEEPDLWATYDRRDMVIYHENDFEVFIDPDGDTHEYYELEMNALNTVWDLLLIRPYRDGGPAVNAWDIAGLKTAVHLDGTLNDPRDRDHGWTVEIAIPWTVLAECAHRASPPADGDQWRVNFSRVEWRTDPRDGGYDKRKDPATGKSLAEANWTWSPQGLIAMHYPEMWGVVQFCSAPAGSPGLTVQPDADAGARWTLRCAYYAEKECFERQHRFSIDPRELPGIPLEAVDLRLTQSGFEATVPSADGRGTLHVGSDGRSWRSEP
jgi:hypothetical protein